MKKYAVDYPELLIEWDYDKNELLGYTPDSVSIGSMKQVFWRCSLGHIWQARLPERVRGNGCPFCSGHRVLKGFNDLATTHPELLSQWDFEKNEITPEEINFGSNKVVWWKCNEGHSYDMQMHQKASHSPNSCPICSGHRIVPGINDFATKYPDFAKEWHPVLNGELTPDVIAPRSNKKFFWLCKNGHTFELSPDKRSRGQGCYYCSARRLLVGFNDFKTAYPRDAEDWDYDKNPDRPEDYTYISHHVAYWKCKQCGHEWKTSIKSKVSSEHNGCKICSRKIAGEKRSAIAASASGGITDPVLIEEWDFKRNRKGPESYSPNSNSSVAWVCSKCGYNYKARIGNRAILGRGCPACANKTIWPGHNDLATTHPQLAKEWHPSKNGNLKPNAVVYGSGKKVWWLCPEGHEYQATILHRAHGTNCPECNKGRQTSFAEQAVFFYVKKVFPDAINHYKDIFNNGMELDIFIPSIRLGIEYDGEAFHKRDKEERERKKYLICKANGIKLKRLIEKRDIDRPINADSSLSILDGPMYEHEHLEKVIRMLLDEIDPASNVWTRIHPLHIHSDVDININRDELEIRKYMTKIKGNSFLDQYPEIAKEWHPTRNGELTPAKVKPHSDIKIWWRCKECGKDYFTSVAKRSYGAGCPACAIKRIAAKRRKGVNMIDPSTGLVIKTFDSITQAFQETGIRNITAVCKGDRKKAGGYMWEYTNA